jgi:hypothetical protein
MLARLMKLRRSSAKFLSIPNFCLTFTISEKFAIGGPAVQSAAALQNFANSGAQAVAAGGTVNAVSPSIGKRGLILSWDGLWVPRHIMWNRSRDFSTHASVSSSGLVVPREIALANTPPNVRVVRVRKSLTGTANLKTALLAGPRPFTCCRGTEIRGCGWGRPGKWKK